LSESRMLGNPHVRFDERDVENGAMVEPLRHRQTKGAATDMPGLLPPRHFPTLPRTDHPGTGPNRCRPSRNPFGKPVREVQVKIAAASFCAP